MKHSVYRKYKRLIFGAKDEYHRLGSAFGETCELLAESVSLTPH